MSYKNQKQLKKNLNFFKDQMASKSKDTFSKCGK